jgi:uncharacterized membrane protein
MVPVVELRGAIPFGVANGLPHLVAAAVAFVGNCVPVPFIILFVRRVFNWMKRKSKKLGALAERLESRAVSKGGSMQRGIVIGLLIFVAIPLPGTGAWTGALIAAVLDIRLKTAFPAIAAGVAIAAVLVTGIMFGFTTIFA